MKIYYIFISILTGFVTSVTFFSSTIGYVRYVYFKFISQSDRLMLSERIDNWWNNSINSYNESALDYYYNYLISLFKEKGGNSQNINIIFFSFCFTFCALLTGNFFSTITQYISIFYSFPVNIVNGVPSELRVYFFQHFYYAVIWFLGLTFVAIILFKIYNKRRNYLVIYSFFIVFEIGIFVIKPATYFGDVIARHMSTENYMFLLWPITLNILLLIVLYNFISSILTFKKCIVVFFCIIVLNFCIINVLPYSPLMLVQSFIVDGLFNRYIVFFVINLLFDYLTIRYVINYNKRSDTNKIYFFLFLTFFCLLTSVLTYLLYSYYIYNIQILIPAFSLNPVKEFSFLDYLYATSLSEILSGDVGMYFYALSTFIPLFILLVIISFTFLKKYVFKNSAILLFYIYSLENSRDKTLPGILPFYIIIGFISVLLFVGTTHLTLITFLSDKN